MNEQVLFVLVLEQDSCLSPRLHPVRLSCLAGKASASKSKREVLTMASLFAHSATSLYPSPWRRTAGFELWSSDYPGSRRSSTVKQSPPISSNRLSVFGGRH